MSEEQCKAGGQIKSITVIQGDFVYNDDGNIDFEKSKIISVQDIPYTKENSDHIDHVLNFTIK